MNNYDVLRKAGIFIAEEVIGRGECASIYKEMQSLPSAAAELYKNNDESRIDEQTRRTRSVEPPRPVAEEINSVFESLRPSLAAHFKLALTRHEPPHFLLYRPGDFFVAHRDRPRTSGAEISSRRLSCVLFLNDDFTGGALNLFGVLKGEAWEAVGFPCAAVPGLLVAFPADMLHEVTPLASGVRATVVTWFR